jgi:hypothetical protein
MKRVLIVLVTALLLALIVVQTVRVSYWKKLASTQTASCNAVIEENNNSCQKAIHDDTDTWLRIHSHLMNLYKLEEVRLANRQGIINAAEEVQLLKLAKSEAEAVSEGDKEMLDAKHTVTFLGPKGKQ